MAKCNQLTFLPLKRLTGTYTTPWHTVINSRPLKCTSLLPSNSDVITESRCNLPAVLTVCKFLLCLSHDEWFCGRLLCDLARVIRWLHRSPVTVLDCVALRSTPAYVRLSCARIRTESWDCAFRLSTRLLSVQVDY